MVTESGSGRPPSPKPPTPRKPSDIQFKIAEALSKSPAAQRKAAGGAPASTAASVLPTAEKVCGGCSKKIELLSYYQANGRYYHEGCFRCTSCRTNLGGGGFQVRESDQSLMCRVCWTKSFGKTCTRCCKAIMPSQIGECAIVETDTSAFHVECFTCQDCDAPLRDASGALVAYPMGDKLYCRQHAQVRASLQRTTVPATTAASLPGAGTLPPGRGRTTFARLAAAMGTEYEEPERKW